MSSAKHIAVFVFVSTVGFVAVAQADPASLSLVINHETQLVQTPTLGAAAGISYAGGSPSPLKVYTDGFLFCANASTETIISTPAYFATAHEDQSFNPAHPWLFATVTDVASVSYDGSTIAINRNNQTTLTCHGTHVDGAIPTHAFDGIFDTGHESATAANYNHLVNWIPDAGFDWATVDWNQVPSDPCNPSASQPARIVEDSACAAVTGVRPAQTAGVRAGSMWTATDGVNFTYVFRVDGRFGAQIPGTFNKIQLPSSQPASASSLAVQVRDAFDKNYLGTGPTDGQYCLLTQLPSSLNGNVCTGQAVFPLNGQPLSKGFYANPAPQPSSFFYYIAVTRPLAGAHSVITTPVVGVAIMVDPAVAAEGGDKFIGDDVVFGFMPTSTGFPWMVGQ
ncbi:MAG: hypothetical protein ABIW82_14195 [Dokdonella sp.]